MRKVTLAERLRYAFDNTLSRGAIALIAWLGILSALLIVVMSTVVLVTGIAPPAEDGSSPGFVEIAWMSLMRTLDAGTMGGDTGGWAFLVAMFVVTLGGVFIVSTFIGILTSGIEEKLEELRKGRSFVVEEDHTVILGWSPQVFSIISELCEANANRKRACIAILAEKDKVEMEDEIKGRIPDTRTTRVVCRTGSPIDLSDLEIVNPHGARSIIVLAPEIEDPDSQVIKTILAITNNPNRRKEPYHVVAEIRDPGNMEVARMVGRDEAQLILVGDLISRITVQTCRQSGLSVVYTELLDFGGDEIYFKEEPELVGKTFGESLFRYEDSAVMGLQKAGGEVLLKPPMDTILEPGDKLVVISEDDDTIHLSPRTDFGVDRGAIVEPAPHKPEPERTLVLGWNRRGPSILKGLDSYVAQDSHVTVVADSAASAVQIEEARTSLARQTLEFRHADSTDRRTLDSLDISTYNHVITLSYSDEMDPQAADARTLITLLHLRDIADKLDMDFSIVSEMLDSRNRDLAEVTKADDFVVSNKLVALMMSQVSENRFLAPLFADLFDPEGSEIYLKPVENYIVPGKAVNFYTAIEAARMRDEVAIGYRIRALASDASSQYGVVVNPDKPATVTFAAGDRLIVVAED